MFRHIGCPLAISCRNRRCRYGLLYRKVCPVFRLRVGEGAAGGEFAVGYDNGVPASLQQMISPWEAVACKALTVLFCMTQEIQECKSRNT